MFKQLFKSKKAESWSKVLLFMFKIYLSGVPQGSVLGPLLFLVYINDIAEHLLSLTRLFADDSSLFYSAAHIDDIAGIINHDMQLLSNWARQWLVTFNPLKTEAVLFTLKKINILPQLVFDNIPINFVDSPKHLGVTFSSTGQWHSHIENIVLSATKILGIMRKLNTPFWTTLSKRRQQHKLSFMFKVNNGIVPSYIQDLIPPLVSEISNYPLRNNRNISVPFNRTSISQKSCIPSSIRLWNSLEDDLKNLSTLQTFKKHITSSFNNSCVPSHFTIGNRYISILHARLQNNCSNLNNDLFRNHLRDNPLCDLCGMIEDAIHYFFHCRKFTMERQVFNDTVRVLQQLSSDMILCGNFNLNMENNVVLFRAVHRYIHATKRFKTS